MAYLMHHGIKGQKWGVRRYQNEDGTLTEAGKARYGDSKDYSSEDNNTGVKGLARMSAKSSFFGRKHLANFRENRLKNKAEAARESGNEKKAQKYENRHQAQSAANANRKAYENHTSTGKLIAQDILMTKYGAQNYRAARARGEGRIRSLLEMPGMLSPISTILTAAGNNKKYGKAVVLSGI